MALFIHDITELTDSGALLLETINPSILVSSISLISLHHVPINDALHLYTACNFAFPMEDFICADKKLNEAAQKENLKVYNPEKRT
jgi:predicted nucleic acid-binding protein